MADETMFDRIYRRLEEMGQKPSNMCDALGIRRAAMSELKSGKTENFGVKRVAQIADYLHVSCDYLILGYDQTSEITPTERSLVSAWRLASDEERENVAFILRKHDFSFSVSASSGRDSSEELPA